MNKKQFYTLMLLAGIQMSTVHCWSWFSGKSSDTVLVEEAEKNIHAGNYTVDQSINKDQWTPLIYAAAKNNHELAHELIKDDADVNKGDYYKSTPLMYAAQNGHEDMVKLLIKHDANVNAANTFKKTALHYAVENNHIDIVKTLIGDHANINAQTSRGYTPLMQALRNKYHTIAKYLLEQHADVTLKNFANETAYDFARSYNADEDVIKLLEKMNAPSAL